MCRTCDFTEATDLAEQIREKLPEWQSRKIEIIEDVGRNIAEHRHVTPGQLEMLERWAAEYGIEVAPKPPPVSATLQFLVIAGYADLDHRPGVVAAARDATLRVLAAKGVAAPVDVLTRELGNSLYDFARGAAGSGREGRWDAVRAELARKYSAAILVETEAGALGRGIASMAGTFLAAGRAVMVFRDDALLPVARCEPTGVDDWKENFARVVIGPSAPPAPVTMPSGGAPPGGGAALDGGDIPF